MTEPRVVETESVESFVRRVAPLVALADGRMVVTEADRGAAAQSWAALLAEAGPRVPLSPEAKRRAEVEYQAAKLERLLAKGPVVRRDLRGGLSHKHRELFDEAVALSGRIREYRELAGPGKIRTMYELTDRATWSPREGDTEANG